MSEYFPMRGICLGCQTGTTCDTHQERAILECDSFDALDTHRSVPGLKTAPFYAESQSYIGLCGDCEIRGTCIEANHTGGVWMCEQFR